MKTKDFIEYYAVTGTEFIDKTNCDLYPGSDWTRNVYDTNCDKHPHCWSNDNPHNDGKACGTLGGGKRKHGCDQNTYFIENKYGCCTGQTPRNTRVNSDKNARSGVCAKCWAPGSPQCYDDTKKYCSEPNPSYKDKGDYTRIFTDPVCINACRYENRESNEPRPPWCDDLIADSASQIHTTDCLYNNDRTQRKNCSTIGQLSTSNSGIPQKHQEWFGGLFGKKKVGVYDTVIRKICEKENTDGIKLDECDCFNRSQSEIFKQASTFITHTTSDGCWWKPCKDTVSFLVPSQLQDPQCATTICSSEIHVDDTGGSVTINDIENNISCSGQTTGGGGTTDDKTDDVIPEITENGDGIDGQGKKERDEEKKRLEKEQLKKEKIQKILLSVGIFLIFAVVFAILVKFLYFNKKV